MGQSESTPKKKTSNVPVEVTVPTVKVTVDRPEPFTTQEEFFENWHLWKEKFLKYKEAQGSMHVEWENTLLNLMGPVGQTIYDLIKFPYQSMNLPMLLQRLDEYSIFAMKRRLPRESVYEYIDDLQTIVRNKRLQHGDVVIKHRILVEINESEFTNAAKKLIPTFEFLFAYNSFTLKQIAFLWDFYMSQKNCKKCGNEHDPDNCPAIGKICCRCNKADHYNRRCATVFIFQCQYCGGSHRFKQCPAFNETCTNCHKPNHFFWKCQRGKVVKCRFCGLNHDANRSVCPALNSVCIFCNEKGHYSTKCGQQPHLHRAN